MNGACICCGCYLLCASTLAATSRHAWEVLYRWAKPHEDNKSLLVHAQCMGLDILVREYDHLKTAKYIPPSVPAHS